MSTYITDLTTLTKHCGHFESDTGANNGYGCTHEHCEDKVLMKQFGMYWYAVDDDPIKIVAKTFSRNKINSIRKAKKFIKKARGMSEADRNSILNSKGMFWKGRCFSFSCPFAHEADFQDIEESNQRKEFDHIESQEDMPQGWGDDLMVLSAETAKELSLI